MLEIFTIICIVFLLVAILAVLKSFIFKKKLKVVHPDKFVSEINSAKNEDNKILVVFNDGYWEVKEEVVTKEWSAEAGTQTFIDFDQNIDDSRYEDFMGKNLERDQFGEHPLRVVKELELDSNTNAEAVLQLKY